MSSRAYTPGLKVKEYYIVSKTRRLPLKGEVLVKKGDMVSHNTLVARTTVPGPIHIVNVRYDLHVDPDEIEKYMLINVGETVEKGQILARYKAFFGLIKEICVSPITGTLELCSPITGQAILREIPTPINLSAYIPGAVKKVLPNEGVVIETLGTYIQGIFGIGGETYGEIKMIAKKPNDIVKPEQIRSEDKGKILVCGALITLEALKKAVEIGANGLVVGGIKGIDLKILLGKAMGVVITGTEEIGITIIITEGFGNMSMQKRTFVLLKKHEGKMVCINGATQIRAGVLRPEIIIPLEDFELDNTSPFESEIINSESLNPGTHIRIIREPFFGALGKVVELPISLYKLETESYVKVLVAELVDGEKVIVPRTNVEIV